ncbi:MAG: hypothetical protein C0483_12275 [Pirellula sp.]|nr:hypothetical protein [Pirellula sp.]
MNDKWRVRELLERILESHCDPAEACAECPELLPKVLQRMEQIRSAEQQLDELFPSHTLVAGEDIPAGRAGAGIEQLPRIRGYEVAGILGRGGMGVVYKAKHLKLNRVVALKMLLAGPYASPRELARFECESQAVAALRHPHIVQIHDVGDLDGRPFFTMEFVEGGSLAQQLKGTPQPSPRAAELVANLAMAVQLAHTKRIIHRDLKPANILLTDDGTPKIADFGLARHIEGDLELTMVGARVGTPSYMAPEQAMGDLGSIGPSVDIYALGTILYEMLTGRPPFRAETAIETERQVVAVEPVPPSRLNANVPRDLETICLKCLRKDPARRYTTAAELADDLRRFMTGQPIHARPVGRLERVWRWGTRNKGVAAALSSIALLLVLIAVGALLAAAHFRKLEGEHRALAREMGALADQKGLLALEKERERAKAVEAENREAGLRKQSDAQGDELRRVLYLSEMNQAGQAATDPTGLGRVSEMLAPWQESRPDLRNWEWYFLHGLCHRSLSTRIGHLHGAYQVAWSPDGARLASAGWDQTICIWNVADKRSPLRLLGHGSEVLSVSWSPDGRHLASAGRDQTVRIWDADIGTELFSFHDHTANVCAVAWSPDGNTIASGDRDGKILIWKASNGESRKVLRGHSDAVIGLAWRPDSRRLASASRDAKIRIWDVVSGETAHKLVGHNNWVNHVAWNLDGTRLASVSNDQTLRIWDPEDGRELRVVRGHTQGVTSVVWNPDGTRLASGSDDQTVKVWQAESGTAIFSLRGHTAQITTVAWSPRGDLIASSGYDNTVRFWDASSGSETPILTSSESPVLALAWHPRDAALCASSDASGTVRVWEMSRREVRWVGKADDEAVYSIAWHPAGTCLAAAGKNEIRLWSVGTEQKPGVLNAHSGTVRSVAWSPDGRRLASGGADKTIRIWDVATKQVLRVIEGNEHTVYAVAWSSDGRRLAGASGDRTVKVWDVASGDEVLCYRGHTSEVISVAWSPDGLQLASAGYDKAIQIWSAASGQKFRTLPGHSTHVAQVIWSPDGTRLASAGREGAVKVWDAETGKQAVTLATHTRQVNGVAWSPDGMVLASSGEDHQIHIHDATPGYVADRASRILSSIDRRLAADPTRSADWQLRAEIHADKRDWMQATADLKRYFALRPKPNWIVFDGVVAGPFPADMNVSYGPEKGDFFGAEEAAFSAKWSWNAVSESAQGVVDFGPLMEHDQHISAYALFPIYSLKEQQVVILLGTDDQARLWLNGGQLYESLTSRIAVPDQDTVPATLKPGWNALLVRVANETGDHALYLRISDAAPNGRRIADGSK